MIVETLIDRGGEPFALVAGGIQKKAREHRSTGAVSGAEKGDDLREARRHFLPRR